MALTQPQKESSPVQPGFAPAETFSPRTAEVSPDQFLETPLTAPEQQPAAPSQEQQPTTSRRPPTTQRGHSAPPKQTVQDELTLKIEKVMEDGLGDAFKEMTPIQQQEFKIKGEQTARGIRELMRATKVNIKKIFELLISWLKLIPGVNRFFIEQEAKIKADRIFSLKLQDISLN